MIIQFPGPDEIEQITGLSRKQYYESKGYDFAYVEKILRLERHYKAMIKSKEDTHHIVPRSRGGSDKNINRRKVRRGDHVCHHDMHGARLPHEQIEATIQFNRKALQKRVVEEVLDLIDNAEIGNKLYHGGVFL